MMRKIPTTSLPLTMLLKPSVINRNNPVQWFNDTAYKLESMEDRRYEKVRRNNIIVKQIGGAGFIAKAVGV